MAGTPHDLDALLRLAMHLAAEAAIVHRDAHGRTHAVSTKSSATDMVSEVDLAAERHIVDGLRRARPDDAILAEESGTRAGTSGVRWVIDPLDGTTNYLYGYPAYAVSIGVEMDGRRVLGVVHDSALGEVYAGIVGRGATRDGVCIAPGRVAALERALVATGFQPHPHLRARQAAVLATVLPGVRDLRRAGSAALDLCAVACGRIDAFYEIGLGPWDFAAGAAIVEAAGGRVTVLEPKEPPGPLVVAANAQLMPALLELLRAAGVTA
jgi:myo-inositol-1(or 4)-monophosphatase